MPILGHATTTTRGLPMGNAAPVPTGPPMGNAAPVPAAPPMAHAAPDPTGLPSFDVARWHDGKPRVQDVLLLDGAGVLRQTFGPEVARFDVEVPTIPQHVLLWVLGAAPEGYEAQIDGRRAAWTDGRLHNAYLLPCGSASRWRGPGGPRHEVLHLHFAPSWLADLAVESGLPDSAADLVPRAGMQDAPLEALVRALVAQRAVEGGLDVAFAEQWAVLAALRLLRAPPPPATRRLSIAPWRLSRVFAHVEEHLAEEITLSDLAAAAGLSRFHFARAFRAETGVTPHHYVMRARCDRAKALLLGDTAMAEIALRCGFAHQAHFSHVFRRVVGTPPGRWRAHRRA